MSLSIRQINEIMWINGVNERTTENNEGFYLILRRFRCGDLRCLGGCDLLRLQKQRQKEKSWVFEKTMHLQFYENFIAAINK